MEKKFLSLLITALLLVSVFALSGCNGGSGSNNDDSGQVLTYGKKYHRASTLYDDEDSSFYVINKNGTGEFSYYRTFLGYENNKIISSYTVKFKYFIVEDTAICFYDSKSYGEEHNQDMEYPRSTWTDTLGFNKDILLTVNGTLYVCEAYLPNIPNFAK